MCYWPPSAAALTLVTAGCGGSGGSGSGSSGAKSAKSAKSGAAADLGVNHAQCMRANDIPNFPDPQDGKIRVKKGSIDSHSPQFRRAVQACCPLEIGGAKGHGG